MFEKITPEKSGISSKAVLDTVSRLERNGYNFHSFMIVKDGKTLTEAYWKPFKINQPHRMYSVTKSFVAVAIGALYTNGLVDLDKPFVSYYPEYEYLNIKENLKKQTVREMLTMTTAACPVNWFEAKPNDRLGLYLSSDAPRMPGTWFQYDSSGSFALGCLVEKLSDKKLISYMREAFLDEIGFSKDAYMLSCPGGHSWGDSAMICSMRDLALFTQLVMNEGEWNGKQLIDRQYMKEAVSSLSRPNLSNDIDHKYAYGYQIWKPREDAFSFDGMGGQYAIALPKKNLMFLCNADNQSPNTDANTVALFHAILELLDNFSDELPDNPDALKELEAYCSSRILRCAIGDSHNALQKEVSGKVFRCDDNPMGWEYFTIDFDQKVLKYKNAQGEKELRFAFGENVFQKFPQWGYSDQVGSQSGGANYKYDCAVSAAWQAGNNFSIFVQIIDKYLGRLTINICFRDSKSCGVLMEKTAEDFLNEYQGSLIAYTE